MPPASPSPFEKRIRIQNPVDVVVARTWARRVAEGMGCDQKTRWEIAIAVGEAASNIVKFAERGTVTLRRVERDGLPAVELEAADRGPGLNDIQEALRDGVSEGIDLTLEENIGRGRGLGLGFGAVERLMDSLDVANRPGGGLVVRAHKVLPSPGRYR